MGVHVGVVGVWECEKMHADAFLMCVVVIGYTWVANEGHICIGMRGTCVNQGVCICSRCIGWRASVMCGTDLLLDVMINCWIQLLW